MGLSTLPVKPRPLARALRTRRGTSAAGSKTRMAQSRFMPKNEAVVVSGRDDGLGDEVAIQEPVKQSSSAGHAAATAGVAGKARLHNFSLWNHPGPNSTGLRADVPRGEPTGRGFRSGEQAMWIIMYIAMVVAAGDGARAEHGAGAD